MESLPAPQSNQLIQPNMGQEPALNVPESKRFDFWGMVQRRKWIIFIFTMFGLVLGYIYYINAEEVYESTAVTLISPKSHMMVDMDRTATLQGVENVSLRHDKIIASPLIVLECLKRKNLIENEYFKNIDLDEDKVKAVLDGLEVVQNRDEPNIYEMTFRCGDQEMARELLNSLNKYYEEYIKDKSQDDKSTIISRIEQLNTNYEQHLKKARETYARTAEEIDSPRFDSNDTSEPLYKLRNVVKALDEYSNQLDRLANDREAIINAKRSGEQAVDTIVWVLHNDEKIKKGTRETNYEKMIEDRILRQLEELVMAFNEGSIAKGENHPDQLALKRRIVAWQNYYKKGSLVGEQQKLSNEELLNRYLFSLNSRIQLITSEIRDLKILYDQLWEQAKEIHKVEFKLQLASEEMRILADIARTIKTAMLEYTAMHKTSDPSKADQQDLDGYYIEFLDKAENGDKIWPHIPTIMAVAGFAGMMLGFGISYLVDLADKTFHSPEEITGQLGIPLIGHIPVIDSSKRMQIENSFIDPVICTFHRPKSRNSEAFRAIRTAIYFNTQGKQSSVIQVTSPTPGDGKSTVASNLAVSIAQSGKRVLLVDADMRRPTVHHSFGIKTEIGFATVLQGEANWQDSIYECEEIPGLSLMPSGAKPSNPAELVTSPIVKELIDDLRREYDFVIIDTPPVLAVTDPCPIAARVDGVILTIRIKKNIKISADRAAEILQGIGASIIGVVVNGVGANTGYGSQYSYGAYRSGYSYNGYGYGYGYGHGKYYEDENHVPVPAARIANEPVANPVENQNS